MVRETLTGMGFLSLFLIFPLLLSADFLILGPSDFVCETNDPLDADYWIGSDYLRPSGTDSQFEYFAHVHLPEGVRIREVTLYYYDNSSGNVSLSFRKHRMYDHNDVVSFNHETSGSANFTRVDVIPGSSINTKLINNQSNRYYFKISFSTGDTGLRVYGVRIKYY